MQDPELRATAWLSRDLAELAVELRLEQASGPADEPHFDVLIVGSGYGGAMALHELAGWGVGERPLRIAMLERGQEYLAGAFPSRMADLAGHVRFSRAGGSSVGGRAQGLFDMRIGGDVDVVLANGLGGGSLINAGVMAAPLPKVFQGPRWPAGIRGDQGLVADMEEVKKQLRAASSEDFDSRASLMAAIGAKITGARPVDITVAQADEADKGIAACARCRDCATGCNERAKLSLDVTLIADAIAKHPAPVHIVTGATVTRFEHSEKCGWKLFVTHTDPSLRRHIREPYELRASHLILAAGTFGSTELLMRARDSRKLAVSTTLGECFSANGDNISTIYRQAGVAPPVGEQAGPTITRMIDLREAPGCPEVVIQDLAIPHALRRLLEESATTVGAVQSLTHADRTHYTGAADEPDAAGIDAAAIDNSLVVAVIGHDSAGGRLSLKTGVPESEQGMLGVVWPEVRSDRSFETHQQILEKLVLDYIDPERRGRPPLDAMVLPNPIWRPLPDLLERLYGAARGPVLSVHPLGGCPMGETSASGVVNEFGQVFDGDSGELHPGLVVLDGSIVPASLGINPSLTIATLARRAIRHLRGATWGFVALDAKAHPPRPPDDWTPLRPVFSRPPPREPAAPTVIEMTEQMKSRVMVRRDGAPMPLDLELRLWFEPCPIPTLIGSQSKRQMTVDASRSRLRLLAPPPDRPLVAELGVPPRKPAPAQEILLEAPVRGEMTLMRHKPSGRLWRTISGLWSWFRNRGLRDITQSVIDRIRGRSPKSTASLWTLAKSAFDLASRAADTRLFEYDLRLLQPVRVHDSLGSPADWKDGRIQAVKRLTYERAANPVNQWMYADLREFPHRAASDPRPPLAVDLPYFGRVNVPLVRIVSQADHSTALIDLASLMLYLARVMLPLHAWSLRLPDRATPRVAQRLPGTIPALGEHGVPVVSEFVVDVLRDGTPVHLRLSRYGPGERPGARPVMLVHGYSASGTTFAHPLLPGGGLAAALRRDGRDVWVLDLRSSAGMPGAREPWFFEQMGCQDIPFAIDHICRATGAEMVDIIAHCMGVAMLALGMFGEKFEEGIDRFPKLRAALPDRVGSLVLSQVGPALVMSPANMARAYLAQWLRQYVGLGSFEFTPDQPTSGEDMVDRLLSAVPYPREDFFRENPMWPPWKRTPWVAARHRMDALYGVTFKLDGMPDAVLEAIDDFFGPLNLQTVAQVIAFARYGIVSDRRGEGSGIVPSHIGRIWKAHGAHHRVLCLHSTDNGLVDIATRQRMADLLNEARCSGSSVEFQNMGHQDSLIGRNAPDVYAAICKFLSETTSHDHESRADAAVAPA